MLPGEFEYRRATSVEEAVSLLAENEEAKLLAGGHSLLPMMKLHFAAPSMLVDIGGIQELVFTKQDGDSLVVGSMTTHAHIASSDTVGAEYGALAEAAASIGDVQVRNRGTIGGSLAHADPAADYGAATLALDAQIELMGPNGQRSVDATNFFSGFLSTSMEPAELITVIRFPSTGNSVSVYEKFAQPASGFAIVGVAAKITKQDNCCVVARIAATGIADRPVRLPIVEEALTGGELDNPAIVAAADQADANLENVRADMYAAEDYRRHLLRVMVRRAVVRAVS